MGNRRVRRFKPEPDETAVNVLDEAEVTPEEAEKIAERFIRKHGRQSPRLAAALRAKVEDATDTSV